MRLLAPALLLTALLAGCGGGTRAAEGGEITSTVLGTEATSTILATEEEKWKGRWREGNAAGQSEGIFTLTVAPDGSVAGKGRGEQS